MAAKRDFGSFHSSNVEELIHLVEKDYIPPELPITLPTFDQYKDIPITFGRKTRDTHFFLDQECVFLNHGAFGGVLREALEAAQAWQQYVERQPLRFYDRELLPHLVHVTRRMATFVRCPPEDLVLVENVTTAINSVIRSQHFQQGDVVYCLSWTYGAVKKLLKQVCDETGAVIQEHTVNTPLSSQQQVIDAVSESLKPGSKLAVFDHIPSNMGFILPVKQLIQLCHQRGVPVLVDGAHALGALDLNISDLDPDYYVTNAHKWFCSPKGAALMYVKKKWQKTTRPLIISHGFGSGFSSEFIWAGLHDYTPYLALHTVLDFWTTIGSDQIRDYIYGLVKTITEYLTSTWKSQLLAPLEMFGSMATVQLPHDLYKTCGHVDYNVAEIVQNLLYDHNIEVPVKAIQGHLYLRLSVHIYNEMSEYKLLSEVVLTIMKESLLERTLKDRL